MSEEVEYPPNEAVYYKQLYSLKQEGANIRSPYKLPLSEEEHLLDSLLNQEREKMLAVYKERHYFPPARYFFGWKDHMDTTRLFKVFSSMPKGGMLHLHGSASLTADWIIDKAYELEEAYVYWGEPTESLQKGNLRVFLPDQVPTDYYRPQELENRNKDFREEWLDVLTLDYTTDSDSVDIWLEFEGYFNSVYAFLSYRPVYEEYYRASFKRLISDGIQHVELRNALRGLYDLENEYPSDSIIAIQKRLEKEMQEIDPAFSLRLIYSNLRRLPKDIIQADIENAMLLRKKYPDMVMGYDLVGEEDAGHTTRFFSENWVSLKELTKKHQIDLPFYFHNGESNWADSDNVLDTYLLKSKRIGHGFNLYRYPALWEKLKANDVCIEICPISNQVLGYVRDMRNHPALLYIQLGIPISISSDDPSIFQYKGVTPDYWAIYLAWHLDLATVKKLSQNGIAYSALTEEEKKTSLAFWERKWEAFVSESISILQGS